MPIPSGRELRARPAALLLLLAGIAAAQPPAGAREDAGWTVRAEGRTEFVAGGEADDGGTLDALISGVDLSVEGPLWRASIARFGLSWEGRRYDADDGFAPYAGGGLGFRDLHTVGLSAQVLQILGPRWGVFLRGGVSGSAAVGAELQDGVTWNVIAAASYACSDDFRGGIGVLVLGRLEEDLLIVPAIQFDWRISEFWRLSLQGRSLEVTFRPEDDWLIGLGASVDTLRARLSDRSPTQGGLFDDIRIPLRLRVRHDLCDAAWIELSAGVDVWRRIEVETRNGRRLDRSDLDPGVFIGIAVGVTF